jgi:hypothetical protein
MTGSIFEGFSQLKIKSSSDAFRKDSQKLAYEKSGVPKIS